MFVLRRNKLSLRCDVSYHRRFPIKSLATIKSATTLRSMVYCNCEDQCKLNQEIDKLVPLSNKGFVLQIGLGITPMLLGTSTYGIEGAILGISCGVILILLNAFCFLIPCYMLVLNRIGHYQKICRKRFDP